jgi:DNA replication protein
MWQEMAKFQGFTDSETFTPLPNSFFRHLLNEIEDADELKVSLHALWRVGNMEGRVHVLRSEDFTDLLPDPAPALEKAIRRGTLIRVEKEATAYYFLNSPRGRASAEALRTGQLDPDSLPVSAPPVERPNIFKLYEENIGPLTPLIADMLKDAEKTYPQAWIAEALEIAVKRNKRNWQYVEAILKRWKVEGHAQKQDRRDAQEDGRRYVEGEYADFIEH